MAKRTTKYTAQHVLNLTMVDTGGGVMALALCNPDGSLISQKRPLEGVLGGAAYVADNIVIMRVPYTMTVSKVRLGAAVAPTGANLIGDVHYHATDPTAMVTIFTTQANRPEIAAAAHTDDSGTPDVTSLVEGGWIGLCIDQIGSTLPGENIIFEILE